MSLALLSHQFLMHHLVSTASALDGEQPDSSPKACRSHHSHLRSILCSALRICICATGTNLTMRLCCAHCYQHLQSLSRALLSGAKRRAGLLLFAVAIAICCAFDAIAFHIFYILFNTCLAPCSCPSVFCALFTFAASLFSHLMANRHCGPAIFTWCWFMALSVTEKQKKCTWFNNPRESSHMFIAWRKLT